MYLFQGNVDLFFQGKMDHFDAGLTQKVKAVGNPI